MNFSKLVKNTRLQRMQVVRRTKLQQLFCVSYCVTLAVVISVRKSTMATEFARVIFAFSGSGWVVECS